MKRGNSRERAQQRLREEQLCRAASEPCRRLTPQEIAVEYTEDRVEALLSEAQRGHEREWKGMTW